MAGVRSSVKLLASGVSIVLAAYAAVLGWGIVSTLAPPTYYVDDWVWLSFNVMDGAGSFCRITGHPTITTNLMLSANYTLLDGSPFARALTAGTVNMLGMLVIGTLVVARCRLPGHARAAILVAFAAVGLSGVLSTKMFWSFGLTDAFALLGAGLAAHGLACLDGGRRWPWLLVAGGTCLAILSFGSGLVLPGVVVYALLTLRARPRAIRLYLLFAILVLGVVMVALPTCERTVGPNFGEVAFAPWRILQTAAITLSVFPAYATGLHPLWATPAFAPYWTVLGLVLMAAMVGYALLLLWRRERDVYTVVLVAMALNFVGAALLVGLTRSATYGAEVGFQTRYTPIVTAFWCLMVAVIVRRCIVSGRDTLRAAIVAAFALTLAVANTNQLGHYVAHHQHLAVSGASVLLAGKANAENENLRRYMELSIFVMKPLPMLVAERKDIFGTPAGRGFMAAEMAPSGLPACRGGYFRMARYDEPGIQGFAGRSASPEGEPLDHVLIYGRTGIVGVGLPTEVDMHQNRQQEAELLVDYRAFILRHLPPIASAYDVGAGWAGLAREDAELRVVGISRDRRSCEVPPVDGNIVVRNTDRRELAFSR